MFGRGRKKHVIERSGIGRHLLRSDKRLLRNRDITASKASTQFEARKTQPCKDPQQLLQISRYQKAFPLLMEKLAKLPPVTSLPNTADRKSRNGRVEAMIILLVLGFDVDRHIHKELTPEEAERLRLEVANIKRSYRDDFVHDSTMMEALFYCGYQAVASGLPLLRYTHDPVVETYEPEIDPLPLLPQKMGFNFGLYHLIAMLNAMLTPFVTHVAGRIAILAGSFIIFGGYGIGYYIHMAVPHGTSFILGYIFAFAIVIIIFDKASRKL